MENGLIHTFIFLQHIEFNYPIHSSNDPLNAKKIDNLLLLHA